MVVLTVIHKYTSPFVTEFTVSHPLVLQALARNSASVVTIASVTRNAARTAAVLHDLTYSELPACVAAHSLTLSF